LLRAQRTFSEEDAKFYIFETLIALRYLHQQNIIYRDVKPENIILDHEGHLKLTDFGLAKKTDQRSYSFCGSIDYMAPEVLEEDGYSFGADHYSLGNLLFELLIGSPPFYHPKFSQ
jgi:serine/threonine protein kinase